MNSRISSHCLEHIVVGSIYSLSENSLTDFSNMVFQSLWCKQTDGPRDTINKSMTNQWLDDWLRRLLFSCMLSVNTGLGEGNFWRGVSDEGIKRRDEGNQKTRDKKILEWSSEMHLFGLAMIPWNIFYTEMQLSPDVASRVLKSGL